MNKKVFLFAAFLLIFDKTFSTSAYNKEVLLLQPNGDTLRACIKGDENHKWIGTKDGFTIIEKEIGTWYFAMKDSLGQIVPSDHLAKNPSGRDSSDLQILSKIEKNVLYNTDSSRKRIKALKSTFSSTVTPVVGKRNGLVILMGFSDKVFTLEQLSFEDLFNKEHYSGLSSGSVRSFFLENSSGRLDYTFDVVGPFVSTNPMAYYGGNDSQGNDKNPEALIREAVTKASGLVDFSKYDNDNDGYVDNVHVIFAGYGEEAGASASAIWSHKWELPESLAYNGKIISSYSCSPELRSNSGNKISPVGVHCHEFCHTLGVPDFYDTDYKENGSFDGTGDWDLMASGSWNNYGDTPAHINGYAKTYLLGWGRVDTLSNTGMASIHYQSQDQGFIRIDTKTSNEFFLLENRQRTGFDAEIPYHGMLIYRIHSVMNFENNDLNSTHPQKCYPLDASSSYAIPNSNSISYGSINSSGCPFPGTSVKTAFSDLTTPSAHSWSGLASGFELSDIAESDSIISFDFKIVNNGTTTDFADSVQLFQDAFGNKLSVNWQQSYILGQQPWLIYIDSKGSYAYLENGPYSKDSRETRLVSPIINCSDFKDLRISFNHKCENGITKVYWQDSNQNNEQLIGSAQNNANWTKNALMIQNPGTTGQLIFEGFCDPGSNTCLDQIEVWGMEKQTTSIHRSLRRDISCDYRINGNILTIPANTCRSVSVFTLDGRCVYTNLLHGTDLSIRLSKGFYILTMDQKKEMVFFN